MQIITKREAEVFVKDTRFTFFCCFAAMPAQDEIT